MNNFPSASHARFNSGPEDWLGCHNTFLQVSSELGIPGLLLYLFLFQTTWKTIRSAQRRQSATADDDPYARERRLLIDATMVSFAGFVLFSAVAHLGYQAYFFVLAGFGQRLESLSGHVPASIAVNPAMPPHTRWIPNVNPARLGGF